MSEYPKVNIVEDVNSDIKLLNIKRSDLRKPMGLDVRGYASNLKDLGYYLSPQFDHKIVRDSTDALVLISIKKR